MLKASLHYNVSFIPDSQVSTQKEIGITVNLYEHTQMVPTT